MLKEGKTGQYRTSEISESTLTIKNRIKQSKMYYLYWKMRYRSEYEPDRELCGHIEKCAQALSQKGCHFMIVYPPDANRIHNLSEFEKKRIDTWLFDFNSITADELKMIQCIYNGVSLDYIKEVYDGAKVIQVGSHHRVADFKSRFVNIENGIRNTCYQPAEFTNRVHIYGACTVRGTGVEDRHTIASFLQRGINDNNAGLYQVMNHGIGCGSTWEDDLYAIENTVLYKGDIIILCHHCSKAVMQYCHYKGITACDCSPCFNRPHSIGEWFTDETYHTNRYGNEVIAEFIYKNLVHKGWLLQRAKKGELVGCIQADTDVKENWGKNPELKEYVSKLTAYRKNKGICGAIVMNCNPFTKGHRYLIEEALREVDYLYVFVVQEDKSFFPFSERFELVKKGTEDLKRVIVLPSGQFMISAITFPGYFYKEDNQDAIVNPSDDLDLFGLYVAPALRISIRFAGEEPIDRITYQYNQMMKERLSLFAITFREIPRMKNGEMVISASIVRSLLQKEEWGKIQKLVPDSTFQYLVNRYGKHYE